MRALAATIRKEVEARLADRIPAALSPLARQTPRLLAIAEPSLNHLLGGGLPLGSLCEVTGQMGTGLASLAYSVLASASQEAGCAYVDVGDSFSPSCAAAAGVKLGNVLWVRLSEDCPKATADVRDISHPPPIDNGREHRQLAQQTCGGWHPRNETKNLAPALHQVMSHRRNKHEGTPGYPNQPLGLHTASQDQVDWERFNLRRVDETDPLRLMDKEAASAARNRCNAHPFSKPDVTHGKGRAWNRLDKALRATDQILQAGGFRVVVLDLALVSAAQAMRVPSATWWRFQKAAQKSDSILLLLTPEACARSSAARVLECSPQARPTIRGVLTNITRTVEIGRQRVAADTSPFKKASGRATDWHTAPHWMRTAGA